MKVLIDKITKNILLVVSDYSGSLVKSENEFEIEIYDERLVEALEKGEEIKYDKEKNVLYTDYLTDEEKIKKLEQGKAEEEDMLTMIEYTTDLEFKILNIEFNLL